VLWERHAAFRIATVNPDLLAAVGQCLGHPFMPINDSLVVKLPDSGVAIPWHQDPPYEGSDGLAHTFGIPNFDCDIYLDDATTENGCLYGLAGYHLAGHVEVERFREEALFSRGDAISIEMRRAMSSFTPSVHRTGQWLMTPIRYGASSTSTTWPKRCWRPFIRSGLEPSAALRGATWNVPR